MPICLVSSRPMRLNGIAERRHQIELDGAGPAHHQGHDVGHQHHDPADQRDHAMPRRAGTSSSVVVMDTLPMSSFRAVAEQVGHPLMAMRVTSWKAPA